MSVFNINLDYESSVRFDIARFVEYTENSYEPLTSEFFEKVGALPNIDRFTVTSEAGRPDLISYKIYGSDQYWWILMLINGIMDVSGITEGTVIEYIDLSDLEDLYFSLKAKETSKK